MIGRDETDNMLYTVMVRFRFVFVVFIAIALGGQTAALQGKNKSLTPSQLYELHRDAVVTIEVRTKDKIVTGTGFFYKNGKTIVTCHHVVKDAGQIRIKGTKGREWAPSRIRLDANSDTAVLHLAHDSKQRAIPHAPSDAIRVGNDVVVIGSPFGLEGSLTTGVVSASRSLRSVPIVQITAPISRGSSGSPVLDRHGRVLGMVSFTLATGQNLNMAIQSKALYSMANATSQPLLGVFANEPEVRGPLPKTQWDYPKLDENGNPYEEWYSPMPNPPESGYRVLFESKYLGFEEPKLGISAPGNLLLCTKGNRIVVLDIDTRVTLEDVRLESDIVFMLTMPKRDEIIVGMLDGSISLMSTRPIKTLVTRRTGLNMTGAALQSDGASLIVEHKSQRSSLTSLEVSAFTLPSLLDSFSIPDLSIQAGPKRIPAGRTDIVGQDRALTGKHRIVLRSKNDPKLPPHVLHEGEILVGAGTVTSLNMPNAWTYSPDGSKLAVFTQSFGNSQITSRTIRLYDLDTMRLFRVIETNLSSVKRLDWVTENSLLICGYWNSFSRGLGVLDIKSGMNRIIVPGVDDFVELQGGEVACYSDRLRIVRVLSFGAATKW